MKKVVLALLVLAIYVMARITVTPVTVTGVSERVSDIVGKGGFLIQKAWAGLTFLATVASIAGAIHRTWIEEHGLKRVFFSTAFILAIVGMVLPWVLIMIDENLKYPACILRGWVGEVLDAICRDLR